MDYVPWYEQIPMPGLLRHARYTYGTAMRSALSEAGYDDLPGNGLYIIGALAMDQDVPLRELVKQLGISKQGAGQLVDTLVMRGYLSRAVDENDRRQLIVGLTERGRAAAEIQKQARERVDAALVAAVGEEDVRIARRSLAALIEMLRPEEGTAA